jgi:DNA (cytosine-5)-methyltransferase 1
MNKPKHSNNRIYGEEGISPSLNTMQGGNRQPKILDKKANIKNRDYASTLTGGGHSGGNHSDMDLLAIPVLTPNRGTKRQNGRRFKTDGEPAFTLTGQDIHGVYDGMKIRRLTPTECERLQGFPDGWTDGISDTQRYKCLGNAVTTNVVQAVIDKLSQLEEQK